ncbi:MAG: type IV pilus modification protein PilV [Steroidobacteraceae bacterium]
MHKPNNKQFGVGMVEVLVALVVMSVGMLGIASLYVTTLQAKTTSLSRMKAVNLAYDMADRIRANPTGGAAYELAISTVPTTPSPTCKTSNCDSTQMAAADLYQWDALIRSNVTGLPGNVSRSITRTPRTTGPPATPEIFTITLNWTEVNTSGSLSYALQVEVP